MVQYTRTIKHGPLQMTREVCENPPEWLNVRTQIRLGSPEGWWVYNDPTLREGRFDEHYVVVLDDGTWLRLTAEEVAQQVNVAPEVSSSYHEAASNYLDHFNNWFTAKPGYDGWDRHYELAKSFAQFANVPNEPYELLRELEELLIGPGTGAERPSLVDIVSMVRCVVEHEGQPLMSVERYHQAHKAMMAEANGRPTKVGNLTTNMKTARARVRTALVDADIRPDEANSVLTIPGSNKAIPYGDLMMLTGTTFKHIRDGNR